MSEKLRICLVTRDIIGPIRNGGIGTAFAHLASLLWEEGHAVTVLYTLGDHSESEPIEQWVKEYEAQGIHFVPLPEYPQTEPIGSPPMREAYRVWMWLKSQDGAFDVIHFHEWQGIGYYSLLARHQGLAFAGTSMCVQLHSPTLWHVQHNAEMPHSLRMVECDYMERQCAELADEVICPSQYLVDWCCDQGWKLPGSVQVMQNLLPRDLPLPVERGTEEVISELVFFGRLEWRKGLELFCTAVKKLPHSLTEKLTVTFLGKESQIYGQTSRQYLEKILENSGIKWQIIGNLDSAGAMEYLRGTGRLAVVASLAENSPYTVLECLAQGIPMLAAETGGIPELVKAGDRSRILFTPRPDRLAALLKQTLRDGLTPARAARRPETVRTHWRKFHQELAGKYNNVEAISGDAPLVSICVTHFNRPKMLERTIMGILGQTYESYEVIVVDDGSTEREAIEMLNRLDAEWEDKPGWTLIRQENSYLGAARNTAARQATGDYLLFMDDDNYARPEELKTFVAVARRTDADILTCAVEYITDDKLPDMDAQRPIQVPLGGCLAAGMYENAFGDANALIRRSVFEETGGFTEEYGVGLEDFEWFAKAMIAGYRLAVIPEPLFCYRTSAEGMLQTTDRIRNGLRALRPYLAGYPQLASGILMAQGCHLELGNLGTSYSGLRQSFEAMKESRDALRQHSDALEKHSKALESQRVGLQKEVASLQATIDQAGEDVVLLAHRLNARGWTRSPFRFGVRVVNKLYSIARRK